jgi:hypothetical protein
MVVDDPPRDNDRTHETQTDEEDSPADDEGREEIVKDSQKDGRHPKGLEEADAQFYIASKDFQGVKVEVIERKLNAGDNQ